jgi:CelD/BcsL family acetyltransferase involved in cellulose biosynthesis
LQQAWLPIKKALSLPQITIVRSAQEMAGLRPLWELLAGSGRATVFQDFHWNLLAFTMFAGREEPFVVCARASYGLAIVPAVARRSDGTLRLLGEELFDYRGFLHHGDDEVLGCALATLAQLNRPLEVVAVRECDRTRAVEHLPCTPFSMAPAAHCADSSPEAFAARHSRLARNLRRLQRLGFQLKSYDGKNSALLRSIYQKKAVNDPGSLFHDATRIEFMANAAVFRPRTFEIFTLEAGSRVAAALITLRDGIFRRFYTGWFDPEFEKHSPAMTLIYEVTRQSLATGLDCDYMTGSQPYKLRVATNSMPLYRLHASPQQLAALAASAAPEVRQAA